MPNPPSGHRRAIHKKLIVCAAATVAALLCAEGAFRLLGIRAEYGSARVDRVATRRGAPMRLAAHGYIPFAMVRSIYNSDPRGYFDPGHKIDHVHNSQGWRDKEHAIRKPPNTYRILGLGDSYLWGQGVRAKDRVLDRLERLLAPAAEGKQIETINTAMPGKNTVHQRDLLTAKGLAYQPDLVIVHFVLNDIESDLGGSKPQLEFWENYMLTYRRPDALSKVSRLWGWARQRFQQSVIARRYVAQCAASFDPQGGEWAACSSAIAQMHRACRERDIRFLFVIFPFFTNLDGDYPFQSIHDFVRRFCESKSIDVIDLRPSYRDYRGPELWVHPADQHPNEIAHAIAARAIAGHLTSQPAVYGLILRPAVPREP